MAPYSTPQQSFVARALDCQPTPKIDAHPKSQISKTLFYLLVPLESLHLLLTRLDLCCQLCSGHVTELQKLPQPQWRYTGGCSSTHELQEAEPLLAKHCCLQGRTAHPVAHSHIQEELDRHEFVLCHCAMTQNKCSWLTNMRTHR